jgi:hypothetical protein
MADSDVITGGCLCGGVRYEARGKRRNSFLCHCRMCQRASGGPFAGLFYMPIEGITLTKGQLQEYQSSEQAIRQFCARCGSPVFFYRISTPNQKAIFVGSLDNPNEFEIKMEVCASSAVSWLNDCGKGPRYVEKPEGMTPTLNYDPVTGVATAS